MTVSKTRAPYAYPCGCNRADSETVQRAGNGAALLITSNNHGTHNPRQPHLPRPTVRRWATDTWPVRA